MVIQAKERLVNFLRNTSIGVPEGSYLSPIDGEMNPLQFAAMKKCRILGQDLAETFPEIADLYRDTDRLLRYEDIAERYIPEIFKQNPMFAARVVGNAVRSLIPREEQERLTSERRSRYIKQRIEALDENEYRKRQQYATRVSNARHPRTEALIRGRGQIPWGFEEKAMAYDIMKDDPEYQYIARDGKNHPDYQKIADDINIIYHDGNSIRTGKKTADMIRDETRKRKKKMQKFRKKTSE